MKGRFLSIFCNIFAQNVPRSYPALARTLHNVTPYTHTHRGGLQMRQILRAAGALLLAGILAACGAQDVQQGVSDAATQVTQTLSSASVNQLASQLPSIEQLVEAGKTEEARSA